MSMQILNVVLWNAKGEMRTLSFKPGRMNIITGGSSTGKSALIDIVDYCLAAGECRVPGVIRRTVSWYGLRVEIGDQQAFVARKAPEAGAKSSHEVYVDESVRVDIPQYSALKGNTNFDALEELLTRKAGISKNVNIPPESATRDELEATIRHALKFCFQPQYEIASRNILFHRQSEPFMAQAIIDTLPYFLGAVREDYVSKQDELRRTRRDLKRAQRGLREEQISGSGGIERGLALLAEAQDAGLAAQAPPPATLDDLEQRLVPAANWSVEAPPIPRGGTIAGLQAEVVALEQHRLVLNDEVRAMQAFAHQLEGYSTEASEQRVRLQSVDLFNNDAADEQCPLCRQSVKGKVPAVGEIRRSLEDMNARLEAYAGDRPTLEEAISEKAAEIQGIETRLRERRRAIAVLRSQEAESLRRYDLTTAQAYVAGRVQLYLEGIAALRSDSGAAGEVSALQAKVNQMEAAIDEKGIEGRVRSLLAVAAQPMTAWAQQLDLEYKAAPLHLDWRKLTIVADTDEGELPLSQMGSGKNWVGYHLLAHFALHALFVRRRRPVPRFLFLDQPTQVFYPPDRDAEGRLDALTDEDRQAVRRMFHWIQDGVRELGPDFQVIITDHADLNETYFQEAVVEKWRGNQKLVPENWVS